jgi:hypothetical protein
VSTTLGIRRGAVSGLVAVLLSVPATAILTGQQGAQARPSSEDVKGFREFTERVQAYLVLRKKAASGLPALTPTDLPEMIAAYQQALARKLQEARAKAKVGDVFTSDAREAFRRAGRAALGGPERAGARAYMRIDVPSPALPLVVNGIYPDTEPITALSPVLLAAYPPLPDEVVYRVVGRTLMLVDEQSRLIVDLTRLTLPPVP